MVRETFYPILNKIIPVPILTKIYLLKMYVATIIIIYREAAWIPFIGKSHWKKLEAIPVIGLRIITNIPYFLKNEILLKRYKSKPVLQSIRNLVRALFYRQSKSRFTHIRELDPAEASSLEYKTKPRPRSWTEST